jgi:Uma2 family endonuclease
MNVPTMTPDVHRAQADRILAELESLNLITDDGVPMETIWHRKCMNLLIDQVEYHLRDRDDFYVGGNAFIYYSPKQARNRDFRGPDFFFVWETTRQPVRECWIVWEENLRTPNVVIELSSSSTRDEDHGTKFQIYRDTLRVGNYFIYDPETRLLEGWRLDKRRYVIIRPDENGRLLSDELGLLLGTWDGEFVRDNMTWLRFFHPDGTVVPTRSEAEKARADDAIAEVARLRDQLARLQSAENPS